MNSQSPLELIEFGLTDLQIHWGSPMKEQEEYEKKFYIDYQVRVFIKDPAKYRIRLSVKDEMFEKSGNARFSLSSTIVGLFQFVQDQESDKKEYLIRFLGLSMLYSTLRGVLSTVSGVFPPDTRYVLPTVNMQEVIREIEAKGSRVPKKHKGKVPQKTPKERKVKR